MSGELALLPTSGDQSTWNDSERALVEAAGLVQVERNGNKTFADRPTVEAFLSQCRRTGLDPIARQIYCLPRKSRGGTKWTIQVSIDGARLVAERSGRYEGQTATQWTADGVTWADVWLGSEPPAAARVGVYKAGFREALYAVARWDSYVQMEPVWENGQKSGERVASMWRKMPDLMLGKVAEMLALRKAFPQDLSGLYSTEEMQQAANPEPAKQQPIAKPEPKTASVDWASAAAACGTVERLREVWAEAQSKGELAVEIDGHTVQSILKARASALAREPEADPDTGEVIEGEVIAE